MPRNISSQPEKAKDTKAEEKSDAKTDETKVKLIKKKFNDLKFLNSLK